MAETRAGDKGVLTHSADRVLWRGAGALVVDKPAGLPTTGRNLDDPDCLQHGLQQAFGHTVWAVHQLDAGTSGLVVFVSRKNLVERWQRRLRAPSTHKDYLAVVRGEPAFSRKLIDAPVGKKSARTNVRVRQSSESNALVEARLLTGRTHQVRVHLAAVGHPLLGDTRYGPQPNTAFERPALHAHRLRWRDAAAAGEEEVEHVVVAPLPADLRGLLERLGLSAVDDGAEPA